VPFLFGVAGRQALPGPVLVRLLTDLGLTPSAARALLARLRRERNLAATREGRYVAYRLDGVLARGFERIRDGHGEPPAWPGHFHALLYQVPEEDRAFRDKLRRAAVLSGFGVLMPGVVISLSDRFHVLDPVLDGAPASARLYRSRLVMGEADAAAAAVQAWDLEGLDARYRLHLERLHVAAEAGPEPDGPTALRRYEELAGAVMVDILRAPALPEPLRPADWCLPDVRAAVTAVAGLFMPAAYAYVQSLLTG
jgi:phenylacetic acid degradation operon negative regulatory protein